MIRKKKRSPKLVSVHFIIPNSRHIWEKSESLSSSSHESRLISLYRVSLEMRMIEISSPPSYPMPVRLSHSSIMTPHWSASGSSLQYRQLWDFWTLNFLTFTLWKTLPALHPVKLVSCHSRRIHELEKIRNIVRIVFLEANSMPTK